MNTKKDMENNFSNGTSLKEKQVYPHFEDEFSHLEGNIFGSLFE